MLVGLEGRERRWCWWWGAVWRWGRLPWLQLSGMQSCNAPLFPCSVSAAAFSLFSLHWRIALRCFGTLHKRRRAPVLTSPPLALPVHGLLHIYCRWLKLSAAAGLPPQLWSLLLCSLSLAAAAVFRCVSRFSLLAVKLGLCTFACAGAGGRRRGGEG